MDEEIKKAMGSAEVCLVLITPASRDRPWVLFESGGAVFGNKPIYVLVHPTAEAPSTLVNYKLTSIDRKEEIFNLIDAIRTDLSLDSVASLKVFQAVSEFVAEAKEYNPECTILHYENRLELQIGYGDVLEWPAAIALPCDNRFDVDKHAEGSEMYDRTLIGQYRDRFLSHLSLDQFRAFMIKRLGGSTPEAEFEIGHVCSGPLVEKASGAPDDRTLFLTVLFKVMDRDGINGYADPRDVWCAYENLWRAVSGVRPESVAVPLLGSGQSGTGLSRQQSCALAALSAVCVALRQPIYPRLHLLCRSRDSYRRLNLRAIANAAGLEYGPRG